MQSEILHDCGYCVSHNLNDAYSFIGYSQHRGRDAVGIGAKGSRIDVVKWIGLVSRFDLQDMYKLLRGSDYHTYIAHVRYATMGRKDRLLKDAHPHVIGGELIDKGNHIIIRGCDIAGVHNGQVSAEYLAGVDRALLRTDCDTEALLHLYREMGERELLRRVPGAYSMAIADKSKRDVIVMRDRTGIKPGAIGFKDGKYVAASEDIALRKGHGDFKHDMRPGTIYYMGPNGEMKCENVVKPVPRRCFFEYNYIMNVGSIAEGTSVRTVRQNLGLAMAEEFPDVDVDIVTFMPRCPEAAAEVYAAAIGKPFADVFYKLRGDRSFMGPTADERRASIEENLHILDYIYVDRNRVDLKGKRVGVIDDSTIRGNASRRGVDLLHEAGVDGIVYLNYTPMIGIVGADGIPRGCKFGVDMSPEEQPPHHQFIARGRSLREIADIMNVDDVYFLSVEGMLKAFEKVGIPRDNLCTYCIGGPHPFLQIEDI